VRLHVRVTGIGGGCGCVYRRVVQLEARRRLCVPAGEANGGRAGALPAFALRCPAVVVEQWFFQRWYLAQDEAVQLQVQGLLASQQLVFANGGLVMHDEASPSYIDMLDQTSAGIRWLAATFGEAALPRVTSQLDPFGHSA